MASPLRKSGSGAVLVATGILSSRMFGLVRQMLAARFLGLSDAADAFNAAFKFPNFLQNLFGEGALSASFIPVYSRLLAQGEDEEARRVAGAVFALLALTVSLFVAIGVMAAPQLIPLIAAGYTGEKRQLTIQLTRIFFPGAGLFVLGAWCLGVLNSHRRFLLSYSAPIMWNLAMIGALLWRGPSEPPHQLVGTLAWASVVGAALQFLIQIPAVLALVKPLRVRVDVASENVRQVVKNFTPVFMSRGVVQISGYIDGWLATYLSEGAVTAIAYSQTVYLLPISLFGMAVSAAELPEMSRAAGSTEEVAAVLRTRMGRSLRQIAFFVIPSAMAFFALGDVIARVLFEGGRFTSTNALYVWGIMAGSGVGLLASAMGRLYSSAFYALRDTKTPLRFAVVRVALTTVLGVLFAFPLPRLLGIDPQWGAAGLTASAGIAGWVEFVLLRSRLNGRIGETGLAASFAVRLWGSAGIAAAAAWAMRSVTVGWRPIPGGLVVLATFGIVYLVLALLQGIAEARSLVARFRRSR